MSRFLIEAEELLDVAREAIVIDTRKPDAHALGHLPGALSFSSYDVFVRGTSAADLAAFRAQMAESYGALGVTRERPVVVYEDETGMRAARELWILEYLGHRSARMLHGGVRAWLAAGGPLTTSGVAPHAATFEPQPAHGVVIGADELLRESGVGRVRSIDTRDATEYAGRDQTACDPRHGRIPGAVWLEWTELLDPMTGKYRSPDAIRALLDARGVDPQAVLAPYCHRGARSANAYYGLLHAGCTRVRNYIGSFHEWSARADLPLET
jgi:thiosulfate/3-mercaptopyruvate sulfurtransferase